MVTENILPQRRIRGAHLERFFSKVDTSGDCWIYTASTATGGYGYFWTGKAQQVAHRWLYEQMFGPVAPGLQIDHLCRVKRCVRPDHLEAVSVSENVRRAIPFRRVRRWNKAPVPA